MNHDFHHLPGAEAGAEDHLKYLLTAFLFGDLSEAGRKEVEGHLSLCADCRARLAELRAVLAAASDALRAPPAGPQPHSFEQRRVERILAAATERPLRRRRMMRRWFVMAAAAVAFALVAKLFVAEITSVVYMAATEKKSASRSRNDNCLVLPPGYVDSTLQEISAGDALGVSPAPNFPAPDLDEFLADARHKERESAYTGGDKSGSIQFDTNLPATEEEIPGVLRGQESNTRIAALGRTSDAGEESLRKQVAAGENRWGATKGAIPELATPLEKSPATLTFKYAPSAPPPASEPAAVAGEYLGDTKRTDIRAKEEEEGGRSYFGAEDFSEKKAVEPRQNSAAPDAGATGQESSDDQSQILLEDEMGKETESGVLEFDSNWIELHAHGLELLALGAASPAPDPPAGRLIESGERNGVGWKDKDRQLMEQIANSDGEIRSSLAEFRNLKALGEGAASSESADLVRKLAGEEQSTQWARDNEDFRRRAGDIIVGGGSPAANPLNAAQEENWRAYNFYRARDPQMTVQRFQERPLGIPRPVVGDEGLGEEQFRARYKVNPFVDTQRDQLSTFAMDVDTASYTRARAALHANQLPSPDEVRVEEFVNYVCQDYAADPTRAFSVFCEGGPAPFGASLEELKITVKARELAPGERRNAVLTFAIDASGSMLLEYRLTQVKYAFTKLLTSSEIRPDDRIAIVAYGAQPYLVLPHTPAREKDRIFGAIASLAAAGSTNVEAGLDLAYRIADESFHEKAQNRVILCTDGVATSGARSAEQILERVQVFARRGIYLSVVGFGRRQYNDAFLEQIADKGNGNYSYVDSREEAARIFRKNLPATLNVLARDAKIQVEFNPEVVSHYRLLGYENRDIKDADFRNDRIDAGEVGPGSTVTALYEIRRRPAKHGDLGKVMLRFHDTSIGRVEELAFPLSAGVLATHLADTSDGFRFIAAAAEFAEMLRSSYWTRDGSYGRVLELLAGMSPEFRARPEWRELMDLVVRAQSLTIAQSSSNAQ